MSFKDARDRLTNAATALNQERADLLAKLDEIRNDPDRSDSWKTWHSEDARETFSEKVEGLSEVIESAASELDAEILRHNTAFDIDSPVLSKALQLSQFGDALPPEAVSALLAEMTNPAEIKFVAAAFRKFGNGAAEIDAMNRAESITAHPISDLAGQCFYITRDPLSSATSGTITDLMSGINAADSAMGEEG